MARLTINGSIYRAGRIRVCAPIALPVSGTEMVVDALCALWQMPLPKITASPGNIHRHFDNTPHADIAKTIIEWETGVRTNGTVETHRMNIIGEPGAQIFLSAGVNIRSDDWDREIPKLVKTNIWPPHELMPCLALRSGVVSLPRLHSLQQAMSDDVTFMILYY